LGLKNILIQLNQLKANGIIQDYAIGGGYAVMYYDLPVATYDLDILVLISGEDDYHRLYEYFRAQGNKIENVYVFIDEMPVQFLPNYISPLFNQAIVEADLIAFQDVQAKVVKLEYLVALLLTAFRPKDRIRIQELLNKADKKQLLNIIRRFDDEQKSLYKRYRQILANT
jgi:hypothetical protein